MSGVRSIGALLQRFVLVMVNTRRLNREKQNSDALMDDAGG